MKGRWLAMTLILSLLSACAWFGGGDKTPRKDPDEIIMYVNGDPISQGDLDRVIQEIIAYAPPQFDEMRIRTMRPQIERRARDQLIEQKVLQQTINKEGIRVSPEQIEAEIRSMDAYYQAHGSSLEKQMQETHQSSTDLRAKVRRQLALNTLIDKRLNISQPTDADRLAYYNTHKSQFTWPEAVRLQQILIAYPTDQVIDKKIRLEMREKAEYTRGRLLAGEDFAKVAMDASNGPFADQGGNMGWINRQANLPDNLIEVAFKLPVGQISDVIQTALGYHIIRINERRLERLAPLNEVTSIIDGEIMKNRREGQWDKMIKSLVAEADVVEL